MGKYINQIEGKPVGRSYTEKCHAIEDAGGKRISTPDEWEPNIVCVVDNGFFAAAGYAYDERELQAFKHPCGRPKAWYLLENAEKHVD